MTKVIFKNLRKFFILAFMVSIVSFMGITMSTNASTIDVSSLEITMESDAKPFFFEEKVGISFTMSIKKSDFEVLQGQVGKGKTYLSAEYGVVILPNYYTDTYKITRENLFGDSAVYDYANYVNGDWVYNGNKIRVVNINANSWVKDGDDYTYTGAIVDIKDGSAKYNGVNNVDLEMCAVGYIKLSGSDGSTTCIFTESAVSSATYTSQIAIEKGEYTDAQKDLLKKAFIDTAKNDSTYTTNHYVKVDNGYALIESVKSEATTINSTVTATVNDYSDKGFIFDESNLDNKLTGTVYANDKLTLNVYYKLNATDGLVYVTNVDKIDFDLLVNNNPLITSKKMYRVMGDNEYAVTYVPLLGYSNMSSLDGTYRYVAGHTDEEGNFIEDVSLSFDAYNPDGDYVYTDVSVTGKAWGQSAARHVAARPFVIGWGVDWTLSATETVPDGASNTADKYFYTTTDRYNGNTHLIYAVQRLYIKPLHSMAYYQKAYNDNYSLKFEYYIKSDVLDATRKIAINDGSYQTKNVNTWYQAQIPFSKLIKNWEYITKPGSNTTGNVGALLSIEADTINKIPVDVYLGNIRFEDSRILIDETEKIVDVANLSELDFKDVLPTAVNNVVSEYSNDYAITYTLVDRNGKVTSLTDGILPINNDKLTRCTLTIKADELTLYTGKFDIYDSLNLTWNTPNDKDLVIKYTNYSVHDEKIIGDKDYTIIDASTVTDTKNALYGKNGPFVKMTALTPQNIVFNLLPEHLMDVYNDLYTKGYVLTFDYYTSSSAVGRYIGTANYENAFKTWRGGLSTNKWGVVSVSFDNFLLQKDASNSGYYFNFDRIGLDDKVNDRLFLVEMASAGDIYIGNFRIEQIPDYVVMNSKTEDVDVMGKPQVELLNALSDWQKEKYTYYASKYESPTWKVTFKDGESVTLPVGETKLDVAVYIAKFNLGAVSLSATVVSKSPDGIRRVYTVVNLSEKTFTNFPEEVLSRIGVTDSNTEILQNVDHFVLGDLVVNSTLFITVAKNETESAQIIFSPTVDVGYYNLTLLDLKMGTTYLYASNFKAYHQHYVEVKKAMGAYFPYSTGMYPDALIPLENAVENQINFVKAGENQGIWIQFSIPKDQPAGVYSGTFTLQLENSYAIVPVTVKVVDYTLSGANNLRTNFGLSISNVNALEDIEGLTEQELRALYDTYYEGLLDYGINAGNLFTTNTERWASTYWVGRPYNPDSLFSFEKIYVDGGYHYQYEYPLVSLGDNDELVVWTGGFKNGYGYNANKVNEWVSMALKYASNEKVTRYTLPIITGASIKFTKESLDMVYTDGKLGYGNYTEVRNTLEDGYRINSVNLLTTRDVYEQIYLASIENGVDLFKKGDLFYTWIDEYSNTPSKLKVAKIITEIMKDYFPDLANWIKTKHNVTDEFALSVIDSISKIQVTATGENTYDFNSNTHWMAHCPSDGQYATEKRRQEILDWADSVYNGEGRVWTYNGGYKIEDPATTIKSRGWWMYNYDVTADLQWAIMAPQYLDGISDAMVGKDVSDGDYITPEDFYNVAVHYGATTGIGFMIYPGSYFGVNGFVPSIRLDSYRDAVEDYNLLHALERFYEDRAKDKGVTYNDKDFDSVLARLTERMYNGVKYRTHDGYQDDYAVSRSSLLNMLVLAEKYGIIVEKCVIDGENITFYVSTPKSISLSGYQTVSTNGNYNNYTFSAGDDYFELNYGECTAKFSVAFYRENALIDDLYWTDGINDAYKTYSDRTVNSTSSPVEVELVELSVAESVGGISEGKYYRVKPMNESDYGKHIGFTLFPELSLEDYKEYASITSLKFDVYFELTDENGNHPDLYRLYYSLGYSENRQHLANEWFTIEVPMENVIERWAQLTATNNDTAYRVTDGNLFTLLGAHTKTYEFQYYIGNFRVEHN